MVFKAFYKEDNVIGGDGFDLVWAVILSAFDGTNGTGFCGTLVCF
jgi:hypothetical protein